MKTEKELHQEFLKLGANRRKLTNELLALLPEIYDRKIYLKYASTIVEYAGKFGGLSKGVVSKRLRLEKYLSDKPKLREAIKTEGVHKVALVASVATEETEEAWVDKLKNMSKNAIQELSKEVRNKEVKSKEEANLFGDGSLFGCEQTASISAPCKAAPLKITIEITDENAFLFLKLKKKIEKESKEISKEISGNSGSLSNKEVMSEILKRLADAEFSEKVVLEDNFCEGEVVEKKFIDKQTEQEKGPEKTEISKSISGSGAKISPKISRYIPVHVKKMAIFSAHGKCAYPNCGHPAEIFHHRERFAESKKRLWDADKRLKKDVHESVVPLCKTHHEFAHNGIIANESQNIEQWMLELGRGNFSGEDILYREIRQEKIKN